jgi:hypothetical protein
VVIWLIMMVSPPFLMMGFTPFALNHNHEPLPPAITLLAHMVYGSVLGLVAEGWLEPETGPEGIRAWQARQVPA